MEPTRMPRIKICCIGGEDEAWTAIRAGASALGLVSVMPSGPGVIDERRIAEIARRTPPGVASFLLTSARDAGAIVDQQRRTAVNTLQIVDEVGPHVLAHLRGHLPGIALVQVIHVVGPDSIEAAAAVAPHVNAILLDSGNPALAVKELGGTGRVHNWAISRAIRERVDVPVYLAGGLRAENVGDAIRQVGPFGIDVCSGVRTDGALDPTKLAAFVDAVRVE